MIELPLSQGLVALIDDCDAEQAKFKWCARKNRHKFYAARNSERDENGYQKHIFLHREIMKPGPGSEVKYINKDTLDNRRSNIRIIIRSENAYKRPPENAPPSGAEAKARKYAEQLIKEGEEAGSALNRARAAYGLQGRE